MTSLNEKMEGLQSFAALGIPTFCNTADICYGMELDPYKVTFSNKILLWAVTNIMK